MREVVKINQPLRNTRKTRTGVLFRVFGGRFNLGWTTHGDGSNVGRVTGISDGEIRETGGELPSIRSQFTMMENEI